MNSIGIQLRISDLLFAVQKRWKIIISLTFLGLLFGVLLSGMNYVQSAVETYQINGSVAINAVNSQGLYPGNSLSPSRTDMNLAIDLYDTVYYMLRSDRLLRQVINDLQLLGISVSDIRNGLSISQYNETNILTMRLTWNNGEEGLLIWHAVVDAANKLLPQIEQVGRLQIFNEAETRLISSRTANIKTWMLLPVLGFGAGMGFAVIELLIRPTLINVKDVETVFGLETIGIIPYDHAYFANRASLLVADDKSSSEVAQNFSSSAYILRNRIGLKDKCHCFYITSSTGQEGRTSVAANLAIQLSDMERHTLLIDFDYKNPMLGSLFLNKVDYGHSLNALYRGEIALDDSITTLTGYLDILPMVMDHNLIYLDSTIIDVIATLRDRYQYIIIDAPPVGKESETLSLNQVADTVLFVARYDTASIPEIQATLEKLDKSGIRIMGCIVNGVKSTKNVLLGTSGTETGKNAGGSAAKTKKKKKKPLPGFKKIISKESDSDVRAITEKKKSKSKPRKEQSVPSAQTSAQEQPDSFEEISGIAGAPELNVSPDPAASVPVSTDSPARGPQEYESLAGFDTSEPGFTPMPSQETTADESAISPASVQEITADEAAFSPASGQEITADESAFTPVLHQEIAAEEPAFTSAPPMEREADGLQTDMIAAPLPTDGALPLETEPIPAKPEKKKGLFGSRSGRPKAPKAAAQPAPAEKKKTASKKPASSKKAAQAEKETPAKTKKAKTAPEKKRTGFFFLGKPKDKETKETPIQPVKTDAAVISHPRNVFDDLMGERPVEPKSKTDEEMVEELLRIGLDGSWDNAAGAKLPDSPVKNTKKNPFDDL